MFASDLSNGPDTNSFHGILRRIFRRCRRVPDIGSLVACRAYQADDVVIAVAHGHLQSHADRQKGTPLYQNARSNAKNCWEFGQFYINPRSASDVTSPSSDVTISSDEPSSSTTSPSEVTSSNDDDVTSVPCLDRKVSSRRSV